jgi:hypothetical protein
MDPEEKAPEEEAAQVEVAAAEPDAEVESDGGGGADRDAQIADSDDPMRTEAQAYAESQGHEEELSDKEVADYGETKQLEQTEPNPADAPEVKEILPAEVGEVAADPAPGEGMPALEGGGGGGGDAAGAPAPAPEVTTEEVATPAPEGGGGAGAGPMPIVATDTTSIHELTNTTPAPVTSEQTAGVLSGVNTTASQDPNVSQSKAKETGFLDNLLTSMGDSFLGPMMPGFSDRRSQDYKEMGKAWDGAGWSATGMRNGVDAVYRGIDLITKYTGPLATVLGIASLIRYLVFLPPCVAIGNFFKVVATFLNALNTILDLVKFALGGVKVVLGAFALAGAAISRDPKAFDEALNNLIGDTVEFAANGFTIAMGGLVDAKVSGGSWKEGVKDAFNPAKAGQDLWKSTKNLVPGTVQGFKTTYGGGKWKMGDGWFQPSIEGGQATFKSATGETYSAALDQTANAFLKFKAGQGITIAGKVIEEGTRDKNGADTEGGAYWDVTGLGASLFGTSSTAAATGVDTRVCETMDAAQTALIDRAQSSERPLTQGPPLPDETPSAPHQPQVIQAEKDNLQKRRAELEDQKVAAKAGQEEGQAIQQAADKHEEKLTKGKGELGEAKAGREVEKTEVATGKQKATEAKHKTSKGKGKMLEGKSGPGGAPGDSTTSVPWYKKPFVGMIRKVNSAKAKVMGKIQGAITNAVMGAVGFDDMDANLAEGEASLDEQDAVLNAAPGKFAEAEAVVDKESSDAQTAKAEAAGKEAENKGLEAEIVQSLSQVDAQEAALDAEGTKIEGETAAFDATYGPTVEELNALSEKQANKELEPMQLLLDDQVKAVQDAVGELQAVLGEHEGEMSTEAEEKAAALTDAFAAIDSLTGSQRAIVQESAVGTKDVVVGEVSAFTAEQKAELDAMLGEASGFSGQIASQEKLQQLGNLCGRVRGAAKGIEEGRTQQMSELNTRFRESYDSLCGL